MVAEPNSLGSPEFLKDLEFINEALSATNPGQPQPETQAISDGPELADLLAANPTTATSAYPAPDLDLDGVAEQFRLKQLLEQACLATGATGAAIALDRGGEMVCRANTGPDAPDIGVCLDPRTGLAGTCIQTRQLQQCNDTETDPRVDAAACRRLGVRSIVVLPLLEGEQLVGVLQILSPRPNAFSQRDLESLQFLTQRILESRKRDEKAAATVASEASKPISHKVEVVVPQGKSVSSESVASMPRRVRRSKRTDVWTPVLGALVIGAAILLGTLVGWRMGWQRATLGARVFLPPHRAHVRPTTGQPNHTAAPAPQPPPSPVVSDECGPSAAGSSAAQPPNGGLTVCQDGRVVFRMPPSPPSPRRVKTSQLSTDLKRNPTQR